MTEGGLAHRASAPYEWAFKCLTTPTDLAWLAAFRFCFGAVMAISMARFLAYGWIDNFFVNPRFHFKYWGFAWVEALPAAGMYAVFWGLLICSVGMAVGAFYRVAAGVFVLGFGYVQLIDVTNYLNHYYLAWLLACLLLCSPAAKAWSFDAWRRDCAADPALADKSVAVGWLFVFRVQVGVVYTYAGLAKAHADWLIDAQPLRIWLGSRTEMPIIGPLFTVDGMPLLMSWFGFLFDSTVVAFLLWPRTRWLAYVSVLVFHTLTRSLFPIGMFSSIMVLAALVFFPPEWPRVLAHRIGSWLPVDASQRFLARLQRWGLGSEAVSHTPPPSSNRDNWTRNLAITAGVCFCAWQVIVPLRFLAYGGNVRWHEQGMRFSWRVMVREKNGSVTFHVRDPRTERTFTVAPRAYLTRLQEREMSGQPDLILQLAHRIRDDYSVQLGVPVEVRVEALVSLNGRKSSPLVDPTVNLAAEHDGLAPYHWVLPAPTTRPPHVRPV
jgi:vitamin K-dependent gamma-carboxylase